jgi:hypothetical protein
MAIHQQLNWNTMHASVFHNAGRMLRWTEATLRPHGSLRYRCPVTGSFVLVTDDASLQRLSRATNRLRCAGCGELHFVAVAGDDPTVIVATSDKP